MERQDSGRFVSSVYGKKAKAFLPGELPPKPDIEYPPSLVKRLTDTNHTLGEINQTIKNLPFHEKFVAMYVRYEASRSSDIEGIETTMEEILDFEIAEAIVTDPKRNGKDIFSSEKIKDLQEVENHISAIDAGFEKMNELPISTRLLKILHRILMEGNVRGKDKQPGEFRAVQNYVGDPRLGPGEAVHIPPPPQKIDELMDNLYKFIHSSDCPVLIKSGIAHVQFETIHPFLDGNGRLGRLLVPLILKSDHLFEHPVFYLSEYFKNNQSEYFDRLSRARYKGDWESWNEFYVEGLYSTSRRVARTVEMTRKLYEVDREKIEGKYRRSKNLIAGLEQLYARPKFTVNQMAEDIAVSYNAAAEIISKFKESSLVKEITGRQRGKVYSYERYMNIFRTIEQERTFSPNMVKKQKERQQKKRK